MNVRVLLFAGIREAAGAPRLVLEDQPEGVRVARLLEVLEGRHPFLRGRRFVVACNREVVGPDREVREGDELALLPPVSGG